MKYFAYGSNMLESRLKHPSRIPTASFISSAVLGGYVIRFNKSCNDGSGKCNIVPISNPDNEVLGILFELDESGFKVLDKVESGYSRESIIVKFQDTNNVVEAETYFAKQNSIDDLIEPYDWYKDLVIAGALEHEFPAEYINKLRQFSSKRDTNDERRIRERKAIGD